MTAIAGLWRFDGQPDAAESCMRMLSSQHVYGPHASAHWSDGDVAFGRRLMRVLPEDALDRQPLVGGNGRYVLVADIRRMIEAEDSDHPLSDQEIADALRAEGIALARRTVAKYRDELQVLPARLRHR